MRTPAVAIIVLNWNGREDSLACLASLERLNYPNYEVVLVDNHSSDGSVDAIRSSYPLVTLIEMADNAGYVGGNNAGLEYAQKKGFQYALLLNNDTEVSPGFLDLLVEAGEADPQVGITGPMIYYHSQPHVIWSAGGSIDWGYGITYMLGMGEVDYGQYGLKPRQVDFVTGCALLIKLQVIERIGKLDPRFYAYYEETEWCVRATRLGYRILSVPQAKIWHKITPAAREASPQVHYYMTRNRLLFLKLIQAGLTPWINTLLFDYGPTLLSWSIKPRWRYKAAQRQAMIRAISDYQRGRFGRMDLQGRA